MGFVLWHDTRGDGYDRCSVLPAVVGTKLTGTATLPDHGPGATARYILLVDHDWHAIDVDVRMSAPGHDVRTRLIASELGRWALGGETVPELDGCLDVSFDFTPVALTPLVRRLALAPGERAEVPVAHVELPSLVARRVVAEVVRTDADRWTYTADGVTHTMRADPEGRITERDDRWQAVALG